MCPVRYLAPAPWGGAEVDHARDPLQETELFIDLQQLEGAAGAPPLLLGLAVVDVLAAPVGAKGGLGEFTTLRGAKQDGRDEGAC